jgi:leucyl aminopeptidase
MPIPRISLVEGGALPPADAVIVAVAKDGDRPRLLPGSEPVDEALGGRLVDALRVAGATGRADEVVKIPTLGLAPFPLVVATGTGAETGEEPVRRAVGAALRAATGSRRVHVAVDAPVAPLAEGATLGPYAFAQYKSSAPSTQLRTVTVPGSRDRDSRAALEHARIVAEAVWLVRDLVNTPPNELYPESFAARAADTATELGLQVEVLDERALRRGGYGGILGVGSGSARPPRLVRVRWAPGRGARTRIALVGKGITFDSGGLNLKTANMGAMKSDMGGAAAALAATFAAARLKVPAEVVATVPMAENMPSGSSYRPSDVLTMRGGRKVEVADTDAEGRLILADGIVRASEDDPQYLLEASTLTGAQLIALGTRVIGAMGVDSLRDTVVEAGAAAGEAVWGMPIPSELRAGLDSTVADLQNLPKDRWGGMLVAAAFLAEFMPSGVPWVHLDIAGPAFNQGSAWGYTPKGGTGAGVRTFVAAIERLCAG